MKEKLFAINVASIIIQKVEIIEKTRVRSEKTYLRSQRKHTLKALRITYTFSRVSKIYLHISHL